MRTMTIVLVMAIAYFVVKDPVNWQVAVSVLGIGGGVVLSAAFEDSRTKVSGLEVRLLLGIVMALVASFAEAMKTVISQVLMDKNTLFDGIYWASPSFVLLSVVFVGATEARGLIR